MLPQSNTVPFGEIIGLGMLLQLMVRLSENDRDVFLALIGKIGPRWTVISIGRCHMSHSRRKTDFTFKDVSELFNHKTVGDY